jgi:hypothetical protein
LYLIDFDALAGTIAIKISHIIKTSLADYLGQSAISESVGFRRIKVLQTT